MFALLTSARPSHAYPVKMHIPSEPALHVLGIGESDRIGAVLERAGRQDAVVAHAQGPADALSLYRCIRFDLVVAAGDGAGDAALCRALRRGGVETGLILLSTAIAPASIIDALDAGADDCIGDDVTGEEFRARLDALMRRYKRRPAAQLALAVDTSSDEGPSASRER